MLYSLSYMSPSAVIYQYKEPLVSVHIHKRTKKSTSKLFRRIGFGLIALALGGITGPLIPTIRLEASYAYQRIYTSLYTRTVTSNQKPLPASVPVIFNPLKTSDGSSIDPVNADFSLVIPKIGINAPIIGSVNPSNPGEYLETLKTGIAHASTSFLPDEDGTVYLFSHSTNYDWFVRDLNAVFYLLKNLKNDDLIVLFYKGSRYTYRISGRKIVNPDQVSYLFPTVGDRTLILQTCWPPGSTTQRLLIFADLIEREGLST